MPPNPGAPMKLSILVLEGCMHSAVAGIADLLTLANHVMRLRGAKARFSWQTLSLDGKAVRMGGHHLSFPVDGAITKRGSCDAIIVPGNLVDHTTMERLTPQYMQAGAWLRRPHAAGGFIGGFFSGVFVLPGTGLLVYPRASTPWGLPSAPQARPPPRHRS